MGKRGAVRNNSGEPVDHSGPERGVGPTTPATAGRKPEACPPISSGVEVGVEVEVGVGLGVGFGVSISPHKSGPGSGGGTPSGANDVSAVLRSNATQRGWSSSLDKLTNNRNIGTPKSFLALDRPRYCGIWTMAGPTPDNLRRQYHRLNCKTWGCVYCGPKKAKLYKYLIGKIAEREQLTRFVTLTLDPSKIRGDSVRYLRGVFNKFRLYLRRKFHVIVNYIAVLEFHKSGIAHLHLLVDRFIPWDWIKQSWSALGGGTVVFVKFVDVHRVSRYLSKYLTKELLQSAPARSRRVTTSRSIHLIEKKKTDGAWALHKVNIFYCFDRVSEDVADIQVDEDGMLKSFTSGFQLA
jgi:hypothetical protein